MSGIDDDYVKIVMHAQVRVLEDATDDDAAALAGATYQASDDPVQGTGGLRRTLAAGPAPGEEVVLAGAEPEVEASAAAATARVAAMVDAPLVKESVWDRVGRNDACPCGSGKKFKFCHGR
jgi:hypothetical protein